MGNCIGAAFGQNGEEDKKFKFWTADEKLSSGASFSMLCKKRLLFSEIGEMDHLIQKGSSDSFQTAENFNVKRVKIVVNKKQLKKLMGSQKEIQLRYLVLQSLMRRAKKWRPSLAAIPEF